MNTSKKIFNAIINENDNEATQLIQSEIEKRISQEKEYRKVALTKDIFNEKRNKKNSKYNEDESEESDNDEDDEDEELEEQRLNEKLDVDEFIAGGDKKVSENDIDNVIDEIFSDQKLIDKLENSDAFSKGMKDTKAENPFARKTIDFHQFELGQQVALTQ